MKQYIIDNKKQILKDFKLALREYTKEQISEGQFSDNDSFHAGLCFYFCKKSKYRFIYENTPNIKVLKYIRSKIQKKSTYDWWWKEGYLPPRITFLKYCIKKIEAL